MGVKVNHKGKSLVLKKTITLEGLGQALKRYNELINIFEGKNGMYSDFVEWLIFMDYVEEEK